MVAYGLFCILCAVHVSLPRRRLRNPFGAFIHNKHWEMSMFAPFRRAPLAGLTAHGLLGKPSAELSSFEAASFSRHATPRPSRPCPRTGPSKLNASALSLSPIGKTTRLSKTVSPSAFPDPPASKSSSGAAFFRAQKHMDMGTPVKSLCPFRMEGRAPATPKGSASDAAPIRRTVCL